LIEWKSKSRLALKFDINWCHNILFVNKSNSPKVFKNIKNISFKPIIKQLKKKKRLKNSLNRFNSFQEMSFCVISNDLYFIRGTCPIHNGTLYTVIWLIKWDISLLLLLGQYPHLFLQQICEHDGDLIKSWSDQKFKVPLWI